METIKNINNEDVKFIKFKHLKYKDQQKDILIKIFNILNITKENNEIKTHLIDYDENKQKLILELDNDIKLYFKTSAWPAYKNLNTERRYLSLVKSIFKEMGIKHESLSCKLKYDNKIVNTTIYTFNKDDIHKYI